jgi:hypothetical protein
MQRHSAVLAWLIAGALGMAFSWWAYPRVFPEASIDLKITPRQAEQIGRDALRQLRPDIDLSGWRSAVEFDWDNNAKFYLEKTLGLTQANAIMREQVSVWFFEGHWEREGERVLATARTGQPIRRGRQRPRADSRRGARRVAVARGGAPRR